MGHEANQCRRSKSNTVTLVPGNTNKECYFVECKINGHTVKGFIDTGCSIVTIKNRTVQELQVPSKPSRQEIRGYAGGKTRAYEETRICLAVDLVELEANAVVVDDRVQEIPVMISQSFLNDASVVMLVRDNEVRLFDKSLAALPEVEALQPKRVTMWAKEAVVIPPQHVGFVELLGSEQREIYIEDVVSQQPGHEYCIPSCVTTSHNGVITVRNLSTTALGFKSGQLLARGLPCEPENSNYSLMTTCQTQT